MGNKVVNTSLVFVMTAVIVVSAYAYFRLNSLEEQITVSGTQVAVSSTLVAANATLIDDTRSRLGDEFDWFTPTPAPTETPDSSS